MQSSLYCLNPNTKCSCRVMKKISNKLNPLSPNIFIQILQTDLYTFLHWISWENMKNNQSIFPLVIILSILITLSLDCILIMWGENWCLSVLGLKGLIGELCGVSVASKFALQLEKFGQMFSSFNPFLSLPFISTDNRKQFQCLNIINNYSSCPNGLWVNSPWGQRPEAMRNNCFSKIQLVGQNYWKKKFS